MNSISVQYLHRGTSFSLGQKMPPVQLFQLIGGVVRAESAIDEAAREAPIPAVFVDQAVHDAIDFCLHIHAGHSVPAALSIICCSLSRSHSRIPFFSASCFAPAVK